MAVKPTEVSTISGNTIKLIVDYDVTSRSVSPYGTDTTKSDYSSADFQNFEDNDLTKISLNGLIHQTLEDEYSDIGQKMRKSLSDGGQIPKVSSRIKYVYT